MTTLGSLIALATALTIIICPVIDGAREHTLGKRSLEDAEPAAADYPSYDFKPEQRDVPKKRAALLLDRLLVALQKAVEDGEMGRDGSKAYVKPMSQFTEMADTDRIPSDEKTMDLQRRGQAKGRVYWRCYFNAVTCFRKKK